MEDIIAILLNKAGIVFKPSIVACRNSKRAMMAPKAEARNHIHIV